MRVIEHEHGTLLRCRFRALNFTLELDDRGA
jgi:hypothetical protein